MGASFLCVPLWHNLRTVSTAGLTCASGAHIVAFMTRDDLTTMGRALASEARLYGRIGTPGEREAARSIAELLRDQTRLAAALGVEETQAEGESHADQGAADRAA
jgi:hypothetical protein